MCRQDQQIDKTLKELIILLNKELGYEYDPHDDMFFSNF